MSLKIFNTMTGRLEEFTAGEKIRMYVCGLTVYDHVHIGHARTYLAFDIIRRYLQFRGFKVFYVQNITDVDDKIINRAREFGIPPQKLTEIFIEAGLKDLDEAGASRADLYPKVTENISDIIKAAQLLIEKGYAYEVDGSVYFDVSKLKDYGKLSKLSPEQIKAGARVELDEKKRHHADFALWKRAENNFAFSSPWGRGRPGWHIECSVMSSKFLGGEIDIHGGALDLIFPHHENEIAQSEALLGKQFVRYWIHTGFLRVEGRKMSKSLGNFILLRDLLKKYDSEVIRLFFASSHYRSPVDFEYAKLDMAKASLEKIYGTLEHAASLAAGEGELNPEELKLQSEINAARAEFTAHMDGDFDTVSALASLFKLSNEINRFLAKHSLINKKLAIEIISTYKELGGILNLFNRDMEREKMPDEKTIKSLIELLIELREQARAGKDYKTADLIRDRLKEMGIALEDTPSGPRWHLSARDR